MSAPARALVSLGYGLMLPAENEGHWPGIPAYFLTSSEHLAWFLPDDWAIRWVRTSDAERREEGARFGFDAVRLEDLLDWTTEAFEDGRLTPRKRFASLEVLHGFVTRFGLADRGLVALGTGLERGEPERILEAFAAHSPDAGGVEPQVEALLRGAPSLAPGGELVGWEVLGLEPSGALHSWLCNFLLEDVERELALRPGADGLFERLVDASRAAELCGLERIGAEPVPWFPAALVRYPLQHGVDPATSPEA